MLIYSLQKESIFDTQRNCSRVGLWVPRPLSNTLHSKSCSICSSHKDEMFFLAQWVITVAHQQDKIITCRHYNDTNAAWVVLNSATQVDRGRQPPVAPILAPPARWLTDYSCLVQAASSSLIERNSLLITAAGNVKSIDDSIKHDSFATQHRVASIQTLWIVRTWCVLS